MTTVIPYTLEPSKFAVSIFQPSGLPKRVMSSTVLHSVKYAIPINIGDSVYNTFLKLLKEAFPEGRAHGLFIKTSQRFHIYEMVLSTDEDCDSALEVPISFEYNKDKFSYNAIATTHPSLDLFKVDLHNIPLQSFDKLKTALIEAFSKYGTVLDIVLFRERESCAWFKGRGYLLISRKKNTYNREEDPSLIDLGFPYFEATTAKWYKNE